MSEILRRYTGSGICGIGKVVDVDEELEKYEDICVCEGDWFLVNFGGFCGFVGVLGKLVSPLRRFRSFGLRGGTGNIKASLVTSSYGA